MAVRRTPLGWIFPLAAGLLEIVASVVGLVMTSGAAHVSLT